MNILVVGLGLIGGSFCKALSDKTAHTIWGYDRDKNVLEQALNFGCISSAVNENEFNNADMVIVCLHPLASRSFMETNIPKFKSNCIVFDVCGIKGQMVSDITDLALQYNIHYVGTHPMAGKEHSGFEFSDKDLFNNANFIVTPIDKTNANALEIVITLAKQIGFGQIIETNPFE
ncbi:MAG TPA: prephenate dehydrogenase, partial [Clostridiales bacterium]|nr:prephenate dehydrogenase [Clostridiales bacterium]